MLAAMALRQDPHDPVSCLEVCDIAAPKPVADWTLVRVAAASLNHHDLWSLRGVGLHPARLPIVLGCEGAGVAEDGAEVIISPAIGDPARGFGDETLDPDRTILSERHDGTFAEFITVPRRNLVSRPSWLSPDEAACVAVAWLTAYRMLFTRARMRPGDTVLVQGVGGGVASAAIALAAAAGARVYATSRSEAKRKTALELGAEAAFPIGARMPHQADIVIESVGEATWDHSLKSVRDGGTVVVCGASSGPNPPADLRRVFYRQKQILGSTAGTRQELVALLEFMRLRGLRPRIEQVLPLTEIHIGLRKMSHGHIDGKIVIRP